MRTRSTGSSKRRPDTRERRPFSRHLLSRGGSADALGLFKNFVGRDPYIEPLLKRRGLDRAPGADDTKMESQSEPK